MLGALSMLRCEDFIGCPRGEQTLSSSVMLGLPFLRLLMVIVLILAPFAMIGGEAAIAAPATAAAGDHHASDVVGGHCSGMVDEEPGDPRGSIDCMVACAGMLPSTRALATAPLAKSSDLPLITVAQHGLSPAAEPRPPRLS
jgi:hypothetical protein